VVYLSREVSYSPSAPTAPWPSSMARSEGYLRTLAQPSGPAPEGRTHVVLLRYRVRLFEWPSNEWRTIDKHGRRPIQRGEVIYVPIGTEESVPYKVLSVEPDSDPTIASKIVLERSGVI
jgi:hypothetical protein